MLIIIILCITGLIFAKAQSNGSKEKQCSKGENFNDGTRTFIVFDCVNTIELPFNVNEIVKNLLVRIYVTNKKKLIFNKEQFSKHVEVIQLSIEALGVTELEMSADLLQPLNKLEFLNMSYLNVSPPRIPETIKTLIMNSIYLPNFQPDMSSLKNLQVLSFTSNDNDNFPNVCKEAPLSETDLSGNPLRKMTYRDLAPFCLMKRITLAGTRVEENGPTCCRIKSWIIDANISSDLHCGEFDSKCDTFNEDDDEANEIYHKCMIRTGQFVDTMYIELTIHYFVVLAFILALVFLVYKYYKSKAAKSLRESQEDKSNLANDDDEEDEADEEEDNTLEPVKN